MDPDQEQRLLLQEQSDLGPHCQKATETFQQMIKADKFDCDIIIGALRVLSLFYILICMY